MTWPFDLPVPDGGYAWWYLDALSDDGDHGLTLIVFVGSVFSPYYARAHRRSGGATPAADHCAINVALYAVRPGRGVRRWTMTERGESQVRRSAEAMAVGPSRIAWQADGSLLIDVDEVAVPWPARVSGRVRVSVPHRLVVDHPLDAAGRHVWRPIAPRARVQVTLDRPQLQWEGDAYLDSNRGDRPLAADVRSWEWSRAAVADGGCAVVYDVLRTDGSRHALALRFGADGKATPFAPPPSAALPRAGWGMPRQVRCDPGAAAQVQRTLEDAPFYVRSVLRSQWDGLPVTAVHESLCLRRWRSPIVQWMLPWRMPRRRG